MRQPGAVREDLVDERPDEGGDGCRGGGIEHHRGGGRDEAPAVRPGIRLAGVGADSLCEPVLQQHPQARRSRRAR